MALDAWLPVGYKLPDGTRRRVAVFEGTDWQIIETQGNGRALGCPDELARRWIDAGLIEQVFLAHLTFGEQRLWRFLAVQVSYYARSLKANPLIRKPRLSRLRWRSRQHVRSIQSHRCKMPYTSKRSAVFFQLTVSAPEPTTILCSDSG
jgi:transposase